MYNSSIESTIHCSNNLIIPDILRLLKNHWRIRWHDSFRFIEKKTRKKTKKCYWNVGNNTDRRMTPPQVNTQPTSLLLSFSPFLSLLSLSDPSPSSFWSSFASWKGWRNKLLKWTFRTKLKKNKKKLGSPKLDQLLHYAHFPDLKKNIPLLISWPDFQIFFGLTFLLYFQIFFDHFELCL